MPRYPAQVHLPDDRVIISGGYASVIGPPLPAVQVLVPTTNTLYITDYDHHLGQMDT
jgi:hypothetical protein